MHIHRISDSLKAISLQDDEPFVSKFEPICSLESIDPEQTQTEGGHRL